jgi:transcriptional regulator with XRE-family HTH domain
MVDIYWLMKAVQLLSNNISALLRARGQTQHDLAQWCHHSDVWLSNFLKGMRQIQLKDLDRIADFFGIATYQLFQPGLTAATERRSAKDRRAGRERRISHAQKNMMALAADIGHARRKPEHRNLSSPLKG